MEQAGAVSSRQEAEHLPQPLGEAGQRHIRAAEEAVARADDRAGGARLPVRREQTVHDRGERRAEHREQEHVQQELCRVRRGEIPADEREIAEADRRRRERHNQGGAECREVIAEPDHARAHRRHGQVAARAARLVADHQQVGAERHRHAAHREQRGHELSADAAVQQLVRHARPRRRERGAERVFVDVFQKCAVEHEQDHGRDERGKEEPLVLEIKPDIAPDERGESRHFASPPTSFLPVTARKTSSILPFVIS